MLSEPLLSWATARAASLNMTLDAYIEYLVVGDQIRVTHMQEAARRVEDRIVHRNSQRSVGRLVNGKRTKEERLTDDREIYALRDAGYTYNQIRDKVGVSTTEVERAMKRR